MKKLMVMIGAAAAALGLFADTPSNYYSTSFEADDGGCSSGTAFEWSSAGWTYKDGAENPALAAQVAAGLLPYAEGRVRRTEYFVNGAVNEKFAQLDTGTNVLAHGIGAGQTFVDQLVKFTGFEEEQTAFDANAKIAVWMSAIEADDTVDPAVAGETNLYVAVGTDNGKTNVKLDFAPVADTWYRLTIKSLGNVNTSAGLGTQLGFQVFINGAAVSIVQAQREYNGNWEQFEAGAKALYQRGQLFTAMTSDATVASVGYKGIGALDDLVISQDAPDFAAATAVTLTVDDRATVVLVKDSNDNVIENIGGQYLIPAGCTMSVTLQAKPGYFFVGGATTLVKSGIEPQASVTITLTDDEITTAQAMKLVGTDAVTTNYFYTLQGAIDDTTVDAAVTLCKDITAATAIVVDGKTVNIDLNTYTIDSTVADTWAIKFINGAQSTIDNGTVSAASYGVKVDSRSQVVLGSTLIVSAVDGGACAYDGVSLTVNGQVGATAGYGILWWNDDAEQVTTVAVNGMVSATGNAALMGSGNDNDAFGCNVTIGNTAMIFGNDAEAIYFPNAGTLTVAADTVVGETPQAAMISGYTAGIYAKSGTVTINGGMISSTTEEYVAPAVNNNGTTGAGIAVILETGSEQGGYANNLSFSITGGTFDSVGPAVYNFVRTGATKIVGGIEGGLFSNNVAMDTALILKKVGKNGIWAAVPETAYVTPAWEDAETGFAVIIAGTTTTNYYGSLQLAFNAAGNGDTVILLDDCEVTQRISIDSTKNITFNANGKNVEIADALYAFVNGDKDSAAGNGVLTVTGNGTFTVVDDGDGCFFWAKWGKIVIENGSYTINGFRQCAYANNNQKIDIFGGSFVNKTTKSAEHTNWGDVLNVNNATATANIQCYAGTYSQDPAYGDDALGPTFVKKGYYSVQTGVKEWTVQDATGLVAAIGDKGYTTLADAIAAAEAGDTIKLLADTVAETATYAKAFTLDLNGKKFTVNDGTTLTANAAITFANGDKTAGGVLNNGVIKANANITFTDFAWGQGGFLPGGTTANFQIAKNVTVTFGTGTVFADMIAFNPNFFNGSAEGAIVVADNTYTKYADAWSKDAPVAEVNGKKYTTLDAALAVAGDGDDVTLIADITTTSKQQWTITEGITLNFNGHTITKTVANDWVFTIAAGAQVEFTDDDNIGGIRHEPAKLNQVNPASMIQIFGSLNVTGGKYESDFTIFKVDEDSDGTVGTKVVGDLSVSKGVFTILEQPLYEGRTWAVQNWGNAKISGGTWNGIIGTRSSDRNNDSNAGSTTIKSVLSGTPKYVLSVGDGKATTCTKGFPRIWFSGTDVQTVTADIYPEIVNGEGLEVQGTDTKTIGWKSLTVNFIADITTEVTTNTQQVVYGGKVAPVAAPEKVGYTFTGWQPDTNVAITVATDFIAQFAAKKFDITFTDAAEWTNVVETAYNEMPVAPTAPAKTGYTFKSWDSEVVVATADKTYTAVYTANVYTVTFTTNSVFHSSIQKDYNTTLADAEIPVIANGTWDTNPTNHTVVADVTFNSTVKADEPKPVVPGTGIDVPEGKNQDEFIGEINASATEKAKYLKAPEDVATTEAYLNCFKAVAKGDTQVEMVLSEQGEATLKQKVDAAIPAALTSGTLAIDSANLIDGFYYSLEQGTAVNDRPIADTKLAGKDTVSFTLDKTGASKFWSIRVDVTNPSTPK